MRGLLAVMGKDEGLASSEVFKEPALRVYVDPNRCIANAKCTAAAPGIFVLDDETGVAVIENEDRATVEQFFAAARVCPTQAIIIEQYGRRVFPRILTPMFGERKSADEGESS
jgi:ferredoxin